MISRSEEIIWRGKSAFLGEHLRRYCSHRERCSPHDHPKGEVIMAGLRLVFRSCI